MLINDESYVSVSIPKNRKSWTEGDGDKIIVKIKTTDVLKAMLEGCQAPEVFKDVALCSNAAGIIHYVVDYLSDKKAMESFKQLHLDKVLKSIKESKGNVKED